MTSRLQLKYGLVSERDRLSTSADAVLVSEPTTGSKARTKGSLYAIVTARTHGGRSGDACNVVADVIRREYYYDESAGIPIVLQKAVRSANRRLRHSREASGLAKGSLGVAVAVVRGNELYVSTCGEAEAYLVRAARLLMPEREPGSGLPADDSLRVDVWRGDFSVGDSLLLCSRNLVDVVGTEELKNAVVTLHPQSAVEHLHHLFVAAGGEGSDAVLALEASEVSLSRVEHRLVPVSPSEPLAGAPERSPIPLADHFAGAALAVQDRAIAARSVLRDGAERAVNAVLDLMPRRRTPYRRIRPQTSRREMQRRTAAAMLSFLGVVALLGGGLWLWQGPLRQSERPIQQVTTGEAAYRAANDKAERVLGSADLLHANPTQARQLLREAWADLDRAAAAGANAGAVATLRGRVAAGLDLLYDAHRIPTSRLYGVPEGVAATALIRGPDAAAYLITTERTVVRFDTASRQAATVARAGEGTGVGMGAPVLLARGGPDLLVVDIRGGLWRWRPSDDQGGGTLGSIRIGGEQQWGRDVPDLGTFIINPNRPELYRLYVAHPQSGQVLRYEPVADGGSFLAPTPYFLGDEEPVETFRQLFIDGDIFALAEENVLRYYNGRRVTSFALADPPDAADLRPGHDYQRFAGTGPRQVGRLYVFDATHSRMLVYDKNDGTYIEQFIAAEGAQAFSDVRGMYLVEGETEADAPRLIFATPQGIYQAVLEAPPEPSITPRPTTPGSPGPSPTGPLASPTDSAEPSPIASPSDRPRRTPRTSPAP